MRLTDLPPDMQEHALRQIRDHRIPRGNKYHVAPSDQRQWQGRTYASKAEMEYARYLWSRVPHEFAEIVEQPRLWLGVPENTYRPDFLVVPSRTTGGLPYYVDVKGAMTAAFKRVLKLWAAYGRLDLVLVRRRGGGWEAYRTVAAAAAERDK